MDNNQMTLFDINKASMSKIPFLTSEQKEKSKEIILNYLNKNLAQYFMLLCHEKRDFTLFNLSDNFTNLILNTVIDDIYECIYNRGFDFAEICLDEAGTAVELWVKNIMTQEAFLYLFFPYDNGVIEY